MAAKRRRFGQVRKLPSGKYQASFVGPTGKRQNAPDTFLTKTDASRWLTKVEADLSRGTWLDDELGRQPFGDYARTWLRDNTKIGPRYRETCMRNLRLHMAALEDIPLRALTPPVIREWYAAAMRGKGGRTSIQQSYRFLHAVLATAVRDGAIPANPANIPGAGTDRAKERPVASVAQVVALIEAITPRYRAAVLLGAWCGLRRGEIIAPAPARHRPGRRLPSPSERNRVELLETRQAFDAAAQDRRGQAHRHRPASRAARSSSPTCATGPGLTACSSAATASRCAATPYARRSPAHAARQTCQASASMTYATPARPWPPPPAQRLKDLMKRLGHSSPAAAQRYLHAVDGRDAEIASALSDLAAHGNAARLPKSIVVKH